MANQISNHHHYIRTFTPEEIRIARADFERDQFVVIEEFFTPKFLRIILDRVKQTPFQEFGEREDAITTPFILTLNQLMSEREILDQMNEISGLKNLSEFAGRIYRLSHSGHEFGWHDDLILDRKLAISINLSEGPYEGGDLEIRHEPTQSVKTLPNKVLGRAVLFIIHPDFKHRVTKVTGEFPKIAYTGWFT